MIRFIRYLLLILILLAAFVYGTLWLLADRFIDKAQPILTNKLIGAYGPGEDDDFGYDASIRFFPLRLEVNDIYIEAEALRLGPDTYNDAVLTIKKIECEVMPLIREDRVEITKVEGREFEGVLTRSRLADYLERNSDGLSDLEIIPYNGRCRIRGRIGHVSSVPMTIIGDWVVDGRGVATLSNREYHNPDSPVPEGMIRMSEDQIDFDVRIRVLDEELASREVSYGREGLRIGASE